jgi:hypothetical protein
VNARQLIRIIVMGGGLGLCGIGAAQETVARLFDSLCVQNGPGAKEYAPRAHPDCRLKSQRTELILASPGPSVSLAEITCSCFDQDGKIECSPCRCKADEMSNCSSFVTRCASKENNVEGNKQEATCTDL